jgi:hypothetical protein
VCFFDNSESVLLIINELDGEQLAKRPIIFFLFIFAPFGLAKSWSVNGARGAPNTMVVSGKIRGHPSDLFASAQVGKLARLPS